MADKMVRTSSHADNIRRAIRSIPQFALGLLAAWGIAELWDYFVDGHDFTDFVIAVIAVALAALIVYLHNHIEDWTGQGFFVPKDRMAGDAVLNTGIGRRKGQLIGDQGESTPTAYVLN